MPGTRSAWKSQPRLGASPCQWGITEFLHLGRYNYTAARRGLEAHNHPGAMEICYLVRGRQTYEVGGEHFALSGGDLFITFPGEVHGTDELPQEKGVLYWVILEMPRRERFLDLPAAEGRSLKKALTSLPARCFRGNRHLNPLLDDMMSICQTRRSGLSAVRLRSRLITFLLEVVASVDRDSSRRDGRAKPLGDVFTHIRRNLEEPLSIPELASVAGLSVPQFQSRFKEQFGVPPGEFVLRAKIEHAKQLLETTTRPITRVGIDLGFGTSQYFATVFRKFTRLTPSAYRELSADGRRKTPTN